MHPGRLPLPTASEDVVFVTAGEKQRKTMNSQHYRSEMLYEILNA